MPLKAGLGMVTEEQIAKYNVDLCKNCMHPVTMGPDAHTMYHARGDVLSQPSCLTPKCDCKSPSKVKLCPKIYTSRKSPLKGEYYVVEGSRFKAKPVVPRIEFKVERSLELNLDLEAIKISGTWVHHSLLQQKETTDDSITQKLRDVFNMPSGYTFPEFDLGYKGVTFEDLKNVLLNCNKGATINTPFYVNQMEPIKSDRRLEGNLQEGERVSSQSPVTSPDVYLHHDSTHEGPI